MGAQPHPPSFSPQRESRALYLNSLGWDTQDASPLSQADRSHVDRSWMPHVPGCGKGLWIPAAARKTGVGHPRIGSANAIGLDF